MSNGFAKLDSGIVDSTLWMQPHDVLRVWIAMLAKCDSYGIVKASVPAMAHLCMVPIERLEQILAIFTSPDPYSRTPADDGRRLRVVEGGWLILNYVKYRELVQTKAQSHAERQRKYRERLNERDRRVTGDVSVTPKVTSDAEAEAEAKEKDQKHVPQAARFHEFWAVYPIKRAKKSAESKWKQKRLDAKADELIADVKRRVRDDQQWRDGFAPHASTYLHQERWTDELAGRKQTSVPSTPSPSCHALAVIERTSPEEREAKRKVGEEQIKKIGAMLPSMRVNA